MKRRPTRGLKAFFSHAHHDRWIARRCVELIEAAGRGKWSTFLDEKAIHAGDAIPDAVLDGIKACSLFFVLLTANSRDRHWVLTEIAAAWALGKPIVALLHGVAPSEMPDIIMKHKAVDLNDFETTLVDEILLRRGKR